MSEAPRETLERALREIEAASDADAVDVVRVRYLGRKGLVTAALRSVAALPEAERPVLGQAWNEVRRALDGAVMARREALDSAAPVVDDGFDPTLPGRRRPLGTPHVLMQTLSRMIDIFRSMGFTVADGPEVETPHYNFTALNIPEGHPTRDEHDSFFVTDSLLLRTQTSPVQIRVMERTQPPVRIIAPGRVYRRDHFDASHSPFFFQLEALYVDEGVTVGDLKGTLREFCRLFFGGDVAMRFRGGYFPFTEPSLELDIACTVCGGRGCPVCKGSGWVEILGSGMVHPHVLRGVGWDPERVSGFAFGMGPDRVALLRHRIPDIRHLYENDLRFLRQFRRAT
jgi:phenylalanyl-tRNA synthetase alpha chain